MCLRALLVAHDKTGRVRAVDEDSSGINVHHFNASDWIVPKLRQVNDKATIVHGLLNPDANESGDLPNIYAAADGAANAEVYSTYVALEAGSAKPKLVDADGSAIVVHASADDHRTQPIGGAGARVACGVIAGAK